MSYTVRITGRRKVRGTFDKRQEALAFAASTARLYGESLVLRESSLLGRIVATGCPSRPLTYMPGERRRWQRLVVRSSDEVLP